MKGLTPQAQLNDPNALGASRSLADAGSAPASWPPSDWWLQWDDPELARLIEEALSGSPSLRVTEARVRRAAALVTTAQSAFYPRGSAELNITRERFSEQGLVPPPFGGTWQTQAQLQADLSYGLDFWGKNRAAYESALSADKAAAVEAFAARLGPSLNVARAYLELQRSALLLDLAQKELAARNQYYELTRQRFDAGLDSRVAAAQVEATLPAAREQIVQLRESETLARNQIGALLGKGPDRGLDVAAKGDIPAIARGIQSSVPAQLLGRRPDIVAQRWRVEAARSDIDYTKAQFYPNINLTAFIGLQSIGLANFLQAGSRTLGAGPAVSLPIFDSGRLRGALAEKNADYDVAVESYNQMLVDALREVVDQLTSLRSVEEQRGQQTLGQASAQEAYDLALSRYREGIANYLEVLTAIAQLLEQQRLAIDLQARAATLAINLIGALGGGYEDAGASVSAPRR